MIVTLPIPRSEADFEDWVLEYAKDQLKPDSAQPYGARGAGQSGIDHQLRLPSGDWIGIQCKRYWSKRLTKELLQKDLDAAHAIEPPLVRYIVATTKSTAVDLQDWARAATIHDARSVDIWFWDDIERWLNADPVRLNRYDARPALVHAQSLALQVGATRAPQEIIAFAASSPAAESEPESVKVSIAFLQAGHLGQAMARLEAERKALSPIASVWRVSAAAAYMGGELSVALDLIQRARVLGVSDLRLDALEAAAWRAQGESDRARTALTSLLAQADGTTRSAVLMHWLSLRLEEDHASYDEIVAEITPADRADPQVHLPLAQAALAAGNIEAFEAHVAVLAAASDKIGEWVPSLLRSISPIAEGERLAVRQGIPLHDIELRDRIVDATLRLDGLIARLFVDSPRAINRQHFLVWRARGAILLGELDRADAIFFEALDVEPEDDAMLQRVAHYAARWNRKNFWDRILERPQSLKDPLFAIMRAARNAAAGVPGSREEMRRIEEDLPNGDGRRAQAIAPRLYLPFDQTDSLEAIDRALAELSKTTEPDALVVGLATQLKHGALLSTPVLQSIRAGLSGTFVRPLHVETHLAVAALLNEASEFELRNTLAPARDAAIIAAGDDLPRDLARESVQLALAERRLNRASELIQKFFPESAVDRLPGRLRAELAMQKGDLNAAMDHLGHLVENNLASASDVAHWVWCATVTGRSLSARHALRADKFPPLTSPKQVAAFAKALTLIHRKRDYNRLLASAGDSIDDEQELFPAVAAGIMNNRALPAPEVAAVDTIAVLRRTDGPEKRMVWITDKPGVSAPSCTRVTPSESWLNPLLGQPIGTIVTFSSGVFAGTWNIEQLLPGAVGTQSRIIEWAARQGISGGGVDSLDVGDDPVSAITKHLQDNKDKSIAPPPDIPIAMLAHARDTIPFRVFGHLDIRRCFFGRSGEVEMECRMLRESNGPVFVDPLTILVAEQLQITETLLKAAGSVRVVAQAQLPLVLWWQEERDHRHAAMSASIDSEGRVAFQQHTPALRDWGRRLWRGLVRWRSDPRVEIVEDIADDAMRDVSAVVDTMDPGTLATLAAAMSTDRPYVSVDGNLVEMVRRSNQPPTKAVSVIGLLQWGAERGAITWLESARAKAQLARSDWSFVTVNAKELSAVMRTRDGRRNADLAALLSAFPTAEPSGAVRVVVDALSAVAAEPVQRRPRALADQLFRALPPISRSQRYALAAGHRGHWFSSAMRAWRKNGRR